MKNLISFTSALFILFQTLVFCQTEKENTLPKLQETEQATEKIETEKFRNFIGKFLLEEGNLELEVVQEGDYMYIISPFSKDPLIQKNDSTLREPGRGVDLSSIAGNDGLQFNQNGYETILKRVAPTPEN